MLKLHIGLLVVGCLSTMTAATPVGTKTAAAVVGAAALGLALAANEPECDDVGIAEDACAALYDEENCKRSSKFMIIRNGTEGVLPIASFSKLRRNDVESLIVRRRCKLELWDDADGLADGALPDLVIDRTPKLTLKNKYIDDLSDDDYKHMDEKISAYRCTCRASTFG